MATVYRFHDCAAVCVSGATRYVDARTARAMAAALRRVARSIESESFVTSECGTFERPDFASPQEAHKAANPPRYVVTVESYSLNPDNVGTDVRPVYTSTHKSPAAAARRLASLISGRTDLAKSVRADIGLRRGGRYLVDGGPLNTFRERMHIRALTCGL